MVSIKTTDKIKRLWEMGFTVITRAADGNFYRWSPGSGEINLTGWNVNVFLKADDAITRMRNGGHKPHTVTKYEKRWGWGVYELPFERVVVDLNPTPAGSTPTGE